LLLISILTKKKHGSIPGHELQEFDRGFHGHGETAISDTDYHDCIENPIFGIIAVLPNFTTEAELMSEFL